MDAQRFDHLAKTLRTRRSALGLVAGVAALLGVGGDDAEAKCKKKCGPCRRCKKGKCKPKPGAPRCGPCSTCQRGRCVAQCPSHECGGDEGAEFCIPDLPECDPPCDTASCSECNRELGQCESACDSEFCDGGFCRIPCTPACGECSACEFGECVDLCPEGVACVDDLCDIPCTPTCSADEKCVDGECIPVCDPPCPDHQGCVAGAGDNVCVDLAGNCPSGTYDACYTSDGLQCSANNRGGGRCVTLPSGATYCSNGNSCAACESDLDCQNQGHGANSRCVSDCAFCGGFGCVRFAGDPN